MTTRFAPLLVVTFVSACGAAARPPAAPTELSKPELSETPARSATAQNPNDDYVVGPFETSSAGVRTYYIVRN